MLTKSCENGIPYFYCEICDYFTCRKSSYDKHIATRKHIKLTKVNTNCNKSCDNKDEQINMHECDFCDKQFKSRVGLWKHKKKCPKMMEEQPNTGIGDKELIMSLIKDNTELKNLIIKVIEKETLNNCHNTNNNTVHTNSHNKTFNLNFFLNETCKDAINIDEFVKSVKVQIDELEHTGRAGYVEGVSNIIINRLNAMNTHKRPIHCTDEKREIIYIKNEGQWVKEAESKPILTNAIKVIANENIKTINEWRNMYPDCVHADSKKNNLYLNIVSNSMSGCSKDESEKNYEKIIKNISKKTTIDKYS